MEQAKPLPQANQLLRTYTGDYDSPVSSISEFAYFQNRVPFRLFVDVPSMLLDSRIQMALWYIKGSILSLSRFFIDDGQNPESSAGPIKKYAIDQISRWWRTSVIKQLSAIEWGFSGSEVMYCVKRGQIHFDHLRLIRQRDCRAVTLDGSLSGMVIENNRRKGRLYLGGPKSLWHVQGREVHPWYGRSRLKSAFDAWTELHCKGGARDVRKLFFYRQSFQGDTLYHPQGAMQMEDGRVIPYKEIASSMLNAMRSGGTLALPSIFDSQSNQRLWHLEPRPPQQSSGDILLYFDSLKKEMAEGVGVPTEVIEASETGSGYSGRRVPKDAFLGMLSDPVTWLVNDFVEQVLAPLIHINFGLSELPFEVIPFGMVRNDDNESEDVQNESSGHKVPSQATEKAQFSLVV